MKTVYVITGGSGGIGLEAAKQLKDGIVIIADINKDALKSGKVQLESMGIETKTVVCDVTQKDNVDALAKEAADLGQVKAVIHTAGVSGATAGIDLVMKVDLIGTAHIIEGFYPYMGEGASMILVASMMGYVVPSNPQYDALMRDCLEEGFLDEIKAFLNDDPNLAYNFSKRGVHLLAEKWAVKFGEKGARINSVSPGIIETPMQVAASEAHPEQIAYMQSITPMKRNGQPEDIANLFTFLMSDAASFITGTDIRIDGGLIKNLIAIQSQ